MQIHITATAQINLGELYAWHREYSQDYADKFHDETTRGSAMCMTTPADSID